MSRKLMETKGVRLVEQKILCNENAALNSGYTLDFLIESFHEHGCSDGGGALEVDYAKEPRELYKDVIKVVKTSPRLMGKSNYDRFSRTLREALAISEG
ncbi:hypothetical protein OQA88_9479 [Cercophora sp. LCS_1]